MPLPFNVPGRKHSTPPPSGPPELNPTVQMLTDEGLKELRNQTDFLDALDEWVATKSTDPNKTLYNDTIDALRRMWAIGYQKGTDSIDAVKADIDKYRHNFNVLKAKFDLYRKEHP